MNHQTLLKLGSNYQTEGKKEVHKCSHSEPKEEKNNYEYVQHNNSPVENKTAKLHIKTEKQKKNAWKGLLQGYTGRVGP